MMTRKILFPLILTLLALTASCGVSKVDDIRIVSVGAKSVTIVGTRAYDGVLLIGIKNPAMTIEVSDMEGIIYYNDNYFGTFSAEPITIKGRTTEVYEIPCRSVISEDVSLIEMMMIYSKKSLEGMKIDLSFKVRAKGVTKTRTLKGIDLNSMIKL